MPPWIQPINGRFLEAPLDDAPQSRIKIEERDIDPRKKCYQKSSLGKPENKSEIFYMQNYSPTLNTLKHYYT